VPSFPRPTLWAKAVRAAGGGGWEAAQVSGSKKTGDFESLGVTACGGGKVRTEERGMVGFSFCTVAAAVDARRR
jgi:hypothetical protein